MQLMRIVENLEKNFHIHIMSFAVWVNATYLDLVLESMMIGCFFELQEAVSNLKKKANPEIEWQYICEPQSASE